MSSPVNNSPSLSHELIVDSFVVQLRPTIALKCYYKNCGKDFCTQSRLDSHIMRRHAVEDNTQSGEPIDRSSHVRHQSLSAALDGRQRTLPLNTPGPSMPLLITANTTSSADNQLVDIISDNDSDSDVEPIGSVGPKRSARNVDIQAPPPVDYKCRVCGIGLKIGAAIGRHMKKCRQQPRAGQPPPPSSAPINTTTPSDPPKRSYSCPHIGCGKTFTNQGLIHWHMSKEHRANGTASSAHPYRRRRR